MNEETRESIQSDTLDWLEFWSSLPETLQAYILLVFGVMMLTTGIKEAFIASREKKDRKPLTYRTAMALGIIGGVLSWFFDDSVGPGMGVIFAVSSGMSAIAVYHFFVHIVWAKFNSVRSALLGQSEDKKKGANK